MELSIKTKMVVGAVVRIVVVLYLMVVTIMAALDDEWARAVFYLILMRWAMEDE